MKQRHPIYVARINVPVTREMDEFVNLVATRHHLSRAEVVRQAIREHLDAQEDVITSRSRLGRTVMTELGKMHSQFLAEIRHISKLLLAGMIVMMTRQGMEVIDCIRQISAVAQRPGIGQMLDYTRKKMEGSEGAI